MLQVGHGLNEYDCPSVNDDTIMLDQKISVALKSVGYDVHESLQERSRECLYSATSAKGSVVLRLLNADLLDDPENISAFLDEGRPLVGVQHDSLHPVLDAGMAGTQPYIAMAPWLPDVGDLLGTAQPREQVLLWLKDLTQGLIALHRHRLQHRDLKPSLLLLRDNGALTLAPIGIAPADSESETRVASPRYMSPEQAEGQRVDARSELYSVGVIAYEMLTGSAPFEGDDPFALAMAHVNEPPAPLPVEQASLQGLMNRLLAKSAMARFQSAEELLQAVEALINLGKTSSSRRFMERARAESNTPAPSTNANPTPPPRSAAPPVAAPSAPPPKRDAGTRVVPVIPSPSRAAPAPPAPVISSPPPAAAAPPAPVVQPGEPTGAPRPSVAPPAPAAPPAPVPLSPAASAAAPIQALARGSKAHTMQMPVIKPKGRRVPWFAISLSAVALLSAVVAGLLLSRNPTVTPTSTGVDQAQLSGTIGSEGMPTTIGDGSQEQIRQMLKRAQALIDSGRYLPPDENAADVLKEALDLDPKNGETAQLIEGFKGRVVMFIRKMDANNASSGQARRNTERALELLPNDPDLLEIKAKLDRGERL